MPESIEFGTVVKRMVQRSGKTITLCFVGDKLVLRSVFTTDSTALSPLLAQGTYY